MITHNDLDAAGSVIVSKLFSLDIDHYMFCGYDDIYDEEDNIILDIPLDVTRLFMVDVACTAKLYNYIESQVEVFGIFDHHERTAEIKDRQNVYWDIKKSGTEIFFGALSGSVDFEIPKKWVQFVNAVSAYDLWNLDSPSRSMGEDLNRLYFGVLNYGEEGFDKYRYFINEQVRKLADDDIHEFFFSDYEHHKIERAKEKEHKEYLHAKNNLQKRIDNRGNPYIIYHGSSKVSFVCSMLLDEYDVKYVLNFNTYTGTTKKRISGKISARSTEPFDVTTLKGIEGHKEAGGGIFNKSLLKRIWMYRGVHLGYKDD